MEWQELSLLFPSEIDPFNFNPCFRAGQTNVTDIAESAALWMQTALEILKGWSVFVTRTFLTGPPLFSLG